MLRIAEIKTVEVVPLSTFIFVLQRRLLDGWDILLTSGQDPNTGEMTLENTPIVARARAEGLSYILPPADNLVSMLPKPEIDHPRIIEGFLKTLPEGQNLKPPGPKTDRKDNAELLKEDFINDICGTTHPFSSLNYASVTTNVMMFFKIIEGKLQELRNPLWVQAYEENPVYMREKRFSLTMLVLRYQDEACLQVMADALQNLTFLW